MQGIFLPLHYKVIKINLNYHFEPFPFLSMNIIQVSKKVYREKHSIRTFINNELEFIFSSYPQHGNPRIF